MSKKYIVPCAIFCLVFLLSGCNITINNTPQKGQPTSNQNNFETTNETAAGNEENINPSDILEPETANEESAIIDTTNPNLKVYELKAGQVITSPLVIAGKAAGWYFEGEFPIKLFGIDNGGQRIQLGWASARASADWMTSEFVPFSATLVFDPAAFTAGVLVFEKSNPSGLPQNADSYEMPVKFSAERMNVKVFFNNTVQDPQMSDCGRVHSVTRNISKTQAVGSAALQELFKGPTAEEKAQGFNTSLPTGVELKSLRVENGIAYADFNNMLDYQMGGSCRVSAVRAQITETLKQLSSVQNVVISIDGRTEDILQP